MLVHQELPSFTIDDSQCGTRPPITQVSPPRMMDCSRQQTQYRQQRIQTSSTSVTPSAPPKQHTGITPPSSTGTMQTEAVRKSPLGELHLFIADFLGTTW
jgi:hypothetical protein